MLVASSRLRSNLLRAQACLRQNESAAWHTLLVELSFHWHDETCRRLLSQAASWPALCWSPTALPTVAAKVRAPRSTILPSKLSPMPHKLAQACSALAQQLRVVQATTRSYSRRARRGPICQANVHLVAIMVYTCSAKLLQKRSYHSAT